MTENPLFKQSKGGVFVTYVTQAIARAASLGDVGRLDLTLIWLDLVRSDMLGLPLVDKVS